MDDESLAEWAERRDAKIGRLRAVPLVSGDGPSGAHLHPEAARAIQRWNGHAWEPYGLASNLAEAKRIMYPEVDQPQAVPAPGHRPLGAGTGKHRKPPTKSG
ncbi:DUF6087 family protein [Streptomyces echinoruber]|uniref:Uncharacterized protein n=1 Tax=Streptomyces echinoruber TaxID=68898 RepID=A0A918VEJ5_9ACTN|nr:DUF6087 family protein [Streptomyces echinoruber]GGZ95136.1 hypothetical protein GCM10010389_37580 [Streptomyces echinoruber]